MLCKDPSAFSVQPVILKKAVRSQLSLRRWLIQEAVWMKSFSKNLREPVTL